MNMGAKTDLPREEKKSNLYMDRS